MEGGGGNAWQCNLFVWPFPIICVELFILLETWQTRAAYVQYGPGSILLNFVHLRQIHKLILKHDSFLINSNSKFFNSLLISHTDISRQQKFNFQWCSFLYFGTQPGRGSRRKNLRLNLNHLFITRDVTINRG